MPIAVDFSYSDVGALSGFLPFLPLAEQSLIAAAPGEPVVALVQRSQPYQIAGNILAHGWQHGGKVPFVHINLYAMPAGQKRDAYAAY